MAIEESNRQDKGLPDWVVDHGHLDRFIEDTNGQLIDVHLWLMCLAAENRFAEVMVGLERPSESSFEHLLKETEMAKDDCNPSGGRQVTLHVDNGQSLCTETPTLPDGQIVRPASGKPQFKGKIERIFQTVNSDLSLGIQGRHIPLIT